MVEQIELGTLVTLEDDIEMAHLNWNPHASCAGVFLKHLVTGDLTDRKFSCHLVRVQAGCQISEHIHAGNWELHEVVAGEATGYLAGKHIPYRVGTTVVIPEGQPHQVVAGTQDLYFLAKFVPALV
ncbi:MAG: cupin domain-containing protein [Anaerolineae bacterium]|nr:cupin domain-containing protein [Anaerolineae bacterium]